MLPLPRRLVNKTNGDKDHKHHFYLYFIAFWTGFH